MDPLYPRKEDQRSSNQQRYESFRHPINQTPSHEGYGRSPALKNPQLQVSHIDPRHSNATPSVPPQSSLQYSSRSLLSSDERNHARVISMRPVEEPSDHAQGIAQHRRLPQLASVSNPNANSRYSFQETPIEMRNSNVPFSSKFNPSGMDPISQSPIDPVHQQLPLASSPEFSPPKYPPEKVDGERVVSPYTVESPLEPHPALFAPLAEDEPGTVHLSNCDSTKHYHQPGKVAGGQVTSPYNVQPPLEPHPALSAPLVEPQSHASQRSSRILASPQVPYSPESFRIKARRESQAPTLDTQQRADTTFEPPPIKHTPTYNPDSLVGPNGMTPESHQPGQIAHPNMETGTGWKHGLCDCSDMSTCCLGCCCPCILYGRTQYELSQKSAKKDPTDLLGYNNVNGACGVMTIACGFQWALTLLQHTRIRRMYGIEGSIVKDCLQSFCCLHCTLIQDEVEFRDREISQRRLAGPAGVAGPTAYAVSPSMTYAPPARQ
ncbi:MAG: hypothetical protein M1827_006330 [Pycnora praestabilis]|nr:MAG: hypothetical protein M1827_006330 [Pycnora praestabilis]